MNRWKMRVFGFTASFIIGLLLVLIYGIIAGYFLNNRRPTPLPASLSTPLPKLDCQQEDLFASPNDIISALQDSDVIVRREIYRRLFLHPVATSIYYDYERDLDYPERAANARLRYINLDDSPEPEAVITFVRLENPVALIMKHQPCGWVLVCALSSWLRFEDYPYDEWLEFLSTVKPGAHEILIHESTGDAISYFRKARLLKLINGSLQQIAEITEESIQPYREYKGSDWDNVKCYQSVQYSFIPGTEKNPPQLQLESEEKVVRYFGQPLDYRYWSETDGDWHSVKKHWRSRNWQPIATLSNRAETFFWDDEKARFVKERGE